MKYFALDKKPSLKQSNLRPIFIAFAFFCCLLAMQNASAATYVVTRVDDRNNATCAAGDCSLREAVKTANATANADTITFNIPAASCNATTNVCTITLTTASGGEITIESAGGALTINGTGANRLTINGGAGDNRIFYTNQATVTISGMTLTGGNGMGAAAGGSGGAIIADGGSLTLNGIYFKGNTITFDGGGVSFGSGTHSISNSTFFDNTARRCGGFNNIGATVMVANSTISGNTGRIIGGGFCTTGGTTTLYNSTITSNTAQYGGGIEHNTSGSILNFGNTIIAGNTASISQPEFYFGSGTITSTGYNLVGDSAGDSTSTNLPITYQMTDIQNINPLLGALTITDGGTTPTHALLTGSPAIDKGFSFGATTDQRGFLRPFDNPSISNATGGNGADIGAFEAQAAPTAANISISGRVLTENGRGVRSVVITLTDSNGNVRTATSSSFGYYHFNDVSAGETYILTAKGKRVIFAQSSRVLNAAEDIGNADFIGTLR